ncbi:hypothetical protein TNCV_2001681 [Trichonephila clavipes]|nr:hypothetical protein TNCV_2001681 [Trichonephila clavipes]
MGTAIPYILQPGALRWFGKTQGPIVKVLPVSRKTVLGTVGSTCVCRMTCQSSQVLISRMPPKTGRRVTDLSFVHWSSQLNQNGLLDELFTELITQLSSSL